MKKNALIRFFSCFLVFTLLISLFPAVSGQSAPKVPALNKTSIILYLNEDNPGKIPTSFKFQVKHIDKKDGKMVWSVEDENIISVDTNGLVSAKKVGSTDVICTISSPTGKTQVLKAKVTVKANAVSVSLSSAPAGNRLTVGKKFDFNNSVKNFAGGKTTDKTRWSVTDSTIATVDKSGYLTALRPGKVYLLASSYHVSTGLTTAISDPYMLIIDPEIDKIQATASDSVSIRYKERLCEANIPTENDISIIDSATFIKMQVSGIYPDSDGKGYKIIVNGSLQSGHTYAVNLFDVYKETLTPTYGEPASIEIKSYFDKTGTRLFIDGTILDKDGNDVTAFFKNLGAVETNLPVDLTFDALIGEHKLTDTYNDGIILGVFLQSDSESSPAGDTVPSGISDTPAAPVAYFDIIPVPEPTDISLFDNVTVKSSEYFGSGPIISGISDKVSRLEYTYFRKNGNSFSSMGSICPTEPGDYRLQLFAFSDELRLFEQSRTYDFSINKCPNSLSIQSVSTALDIDNHRFLPTVKTLQQNGTPVFTYEPVDNGSLDADGFPNRTGDYIVHAVIPESEHYKAVSADYRFTVFNIISVLRTDIFQSEDDEAPLAMYVTEGTDGTASVIGGDLSVPGSSSSNLATELGITLQNGSLKIAPESPANLSIIMDGSSGGSLSGLEIGNNLNATLSTGLEGSTGTAAQLPTNNRINISSLVVNGTLEVSNASLRCGQIDVTSPNSLYFENVVLAGETKEQGCTIRTTDSGHVVFDGLQPSSRVNVLIDGNNCLVEIPSEQAGLLSISGAQASAELNYDGEKECLYGSVNRIFDSILEDLNDANTSATLTLEKNAVVTKDTFIPKNLNIVLKNGVTLTASDGVKLSYEQEPTPVPTATSVPTETPVPTEPPVPTETPAGTVTPVPTESNGNTGRTLIIIGVTVVVLAGVAVIICFKRKTGK